MSPRGLRTLVLTLAGSVAFWFALAVLVLVALAGCGSSYDDGYYPPPPVIVHHYGGPSIHVYHAPSVHVHVYAPPRVRTYRAPSARVGRR